MGRITASAGRPDARPTLAQRRVACKREGRAFAGRGPSGLDGGHPSSDTAELRRSPLTKILVTVKRFPDPDESLKFTNGGLDLSSVKWVPNAFDEYAVETALRLSEDVVNKKNKLAEIIVLSICPQKQRQHMTQFLAMGADRGVIVDADEGEFDTGAIAKMIAKVAKDEG